MPDLSSEEKRRAFQLYFQGAVYNANEAAAVEALTEFLSRFEPASVPDLMVTVVEFARTAERHAFVRRFLRRGAEVIASWSREHDSGLRRLRDWVASHRDVLDGDLGRFFATLGYPIDDRAAELDRAGHIRRLEDPAAPIALRERSVEVVATELSSQEVAILAQKLMAEGGNRGQRLLNTVWARWVRQRKAPDVAEVLVGILLREHEGQGIRAWALARTEELDMSGRLADFVCQRIQSRRVGEALDPELREVLPELRSQTVGRIVRDRLLKERARNGERADIGASPAVRDALALLGVDPEVYAFIEHVLEDRKEQIQALTAERGRLEEKLEDILASVEIKSEIRRLVDESLGAREAQLRQEWERDLETARLEVANLYVDLATFVNSVRSSLGEDSGAIADILIRRLEQLLSSSLGLTILGRVGEAARFDPDLHQSAEGRIAEGEEVMVLRPGVRKVGPGGAVSRAVVKRA
jgi:hypothetical protein